MINFQLQIEATSQNRFGIGVFIAEDGGDAVDPNGVCQHTILIPVIPTPGQTPTSGQLMSGAGPYFNDSKNGGDACGDLIQGQLNFFNLPTAKVLCVADPNGTLQVSTVVGWDQNQNDICNGVQDAFPSTKSQCA